MTMSKQSRAGGGGLGLKFEVMANTMHDLACLASLTSFNTYTKGNTKGSKTNKGAPTFAQK